jgi:hypothetical protein
MGPKVVAAITDGRLDDSAESSGRASGRGLVKVFGPREQILYGEFDGRRRKRVLVKIVGK